MLRNINAIFRIDIGKYRYRCTNLYQCILNVYIVVKYNKKHYWYIYLIFLSINIYNDCWNNVWINKTWGERVIHLLFIEPSLTDRLSPQLQADEQSLKKTHRTWLSFSSSSFVALALLLCLRRPSLPLDWFLFETDNYSLLLAKETCK